MRLGAVALSVFLAVAGGAAYLGLQRTIAWQSLESQAQDWRFLWRGPRAVPDSIAIVAIDDESLSTVGNWPLRRQVLADAVRRLSAQGASVIGFDLLLLDREGDAAGDKALAAALADAGNAVLATAYRVKAPAGGAESNLAAGVAGELLTPPPVLTAAADLGHVNVMVDADGRLRRLLPAIGRGDLRFPALPIQMVRLHRERGGQPPDLADIEPGGGGFGPWLDFYGPAESIPRIPLVDLLGGQTGVDLQGRAVLIGATAEGIGDAFATPYSVRMPGVEYFATALGNLLEGRFVRRDELTVAIDAVAVTIAVAAALLLVRLLPPVMATGLAIAIGAMWLAGTQALFVREGIWLSAVAPPLAVVVTTIGALAARLIAERRAHRDSATRERNLRRYVAPALADDLAAQENPSYSGRTQSVAVLFTDIAGFTTISEAIGPQKTAALLQAFHEKVETAVNENGGVLTSFLGDGAMAVFGLPEPKPDDPLRAVRAARALIRDIDDWAPLRIGVGIHCGPVTIARLGGRAQRQLSATGDTVNLASRLESRTRQHDALIAVSTSVIDAVRAAGGEDLLVDFHHAAREQVKGRREPVDVWVLSAKTAREAAGVI